MSTRQDISEYCLACVNEKLQPVQLSAITTRSTLCVKQAITILASLSTIFYIVFHIHSYDERSVFDTILGLILGLMWIICLIFELKYSINGAIHLHFQQYKSLSISLLFVSIILVYNGELTAIAIVIFMCIEMAITCIKCGFGTINPNSLQNLIVSSGLKLQSLPFSVLSTAGYFNGIQLIQRDFIEFYRDINYTLFQDLKTAQRYPKQTHIAIYNDMINIYNLCLESHYSVLNEDKREYDLVLSK